MEELRKSIIKQEEEKMNNKLTLLEQSVGYPLNEYMNQEFINKIPEDSFLWQVLSNKYLVMKGEKPSKQDIREHKLYEEITFHDFVNECLQAIMFFHLIIMDFKLNLRIITDSIQTLQQQIQILKEYQQIKFDQPNRLSISYTRHKSLKTEIFRYYKIKYKVAMNQQEQKSIYSYGDDLTCSFPILPESNTLHFTILGKRIDGGDKFEILSKIDMGLDEVLVSFDLKTYSKELIKPCILTLDYRDESQDALYDGPNPIELRFQLQMPCEQRIQLMEGLLERQKKVEDQYREQMQLKNNSIQQIIEPFDDIIYIQGEDLKHRNSTEDREFCSACLIF
ncbi:unnamed protein product [Paramecium pentaurelia]|uniref:Uncharacterized protein n=1 Tax=Paramecium pentaurelia TaxID=43138 RepID=A0A8S1VB83_9CILI|nr:unnamed protein product [Paramecium pentaurelia]